MSIISTSLTVPGQPSPQFHVKVWLPTRNCEMDYLDTRLNVCRALAARCAPNGHISRVSHDTLTLEKKVNNEFKGYLGSVQTIHSFQSISILTV